jgi:hypothetical protein
VATPAVPTCTSALPVDRAFNRLRRELRADVTAALMTRTLPSAPSHRYAHSQHTGARRTEESDARGRTRTCRLRSSAIRSMRIFLRPTAPSRRPHPLHPSSGQPGRGATRSDQGPRREATCGMWSTGIQRVVATGTRAVVNRQQLASSRARLTCFPHVSPFARARGGDGPLRRSARSFLTVEDAAHERRTFAWSAEGRVGVFHRRRKPRALEQEGRVGDALVDVNVTRRWQQGLSSAVSCVLQPLEGAARLENAALPAVTDSTARRCAYTTRSELRGSSDITPGGLPRRSTTVHQ